MKQKGFAPFLILLLFATLGLFGFLSYRFLQKQPNALQKNILVKNKLNKIAFISDGNIWTVNPDGTEMKMLTDIDYSLDISKKELDNYKASFFQTISISPDGSHLAVAGISNSVKKVLEGDDDELKKEYLLGDYWFPTHLDIYYFDLINNTTGVINLEKYGYSNNDHIQIRRMEWLPDNKHLFLAIQNSDNIIINLSDSSEKAVKVPGTLYKRGESDDLYAAYVPEVKSLFFDSIFSVYATSAEISQASLISNPIVPTVVYSLPNERVRSFVIPGVNGDIYFHTLKDNRTILHKYSVINKTDNTLLDIPTCSLIKESINTSCIDLPDKSEGFTYYSENFISPNGKYVVARLDKGQHAEIYRISDMKMIFPIVSGKYSGFKWGLDGETILVIDITNRLFVFNLNTSNEITLKNKVSTALGNTIEQSFDWNYLY